MKKDNCPTEDIDISIIIPHKNTPKLLSRCLRSIPVDPKIEVIIIDDNSDPVFVDFKNFPGTNREHTTITFSKNNGGAGHARNLGLQQANGKWVIFSDADDFFTSNSFATFSKYIDSEFDYIQFKHDACFSDSLERTSRLDNQNKLVDNFVFSPNMENEELIRYKIPSPISKMIRRSFIKNEKISFDECIASNDVMFSVRIGHCAKQIHISDKIVYTTTVRKGSLTKRLDSKIFLSRYLVHIDYNKFVKKNHNKKFRYYLFVSTYKALTKFGTNEFIKYIKISIQKRANPFYGIFPLMIIKTKSFFVKGDNEEKQHKSYWT